MKLWEKEGGTSPADYSREIEDFTVGKDRELDLYLAKYDIVGSLAHINMLEKVGLLQKEELDQLRPALQALYRQCEGGDFRIEEEVEDVHSQVEWVLTQTLGEVGKKIHAGRSRNDQVLLDLKLYMREEIRQLAIHTKSFFDTLIQLSETYKSYLLPGYTHLQVAMPSSFGLWFGAYAESLTDDLLLLRGAYDIVNQNPLGSAAGYGSSFPLDREYTTELLGFAQLNYNVVYAQMGRGKAEKILSYALANLAATLGRMAMDVGLYVNQNFDFIKLPEAFTTGSSIMPHKKNPDVFEIMRGRANMLQALPQQITLLMTNLPSGYHREMQLIKEILFPAFSQLQEMMALSGMALEKAEIKKNILAEAQYDLLFTVEAVNKRVLQGIPFRDAYRQVAEDIASGAYQADRNVQHQHLGSMGNLGNERIVQKMEAVLEGFPFDVAQRAERALVEEAC